MKVEIDPRVPEFLRQQGGQALTLDLEEIPSACCVGRLPEMKISYRPPEHPDRYRHFNVDGVELHLSKLLRTRDTLRVSLTGMGPFKKIEVAGIHLIL